MNIWILQTGEPLHIDGNNPRSMRAMNLSNALVAAGHQVILWSSAFYHQEKRHRSHVAKLITVSEQLKIQLIPSRGYKRHIGIERLVDHAGMALNLKKILSQVVLLPDVVFVGYPPIETAAVMTRWLKRRNIPVLLDVKDQWPSIFLEPMPSFARPAGRLILWPYFYLARRAMRDATGLSAMADDFLSWALSCSGRGRSDKDGVFPLTSPQGLVSVSELDKARDWWNRKGVLDDGTPRIFFAGSFMSIFDWQSVRITASLLSNNRSPCEFIICGDGGFAQELYDTMSGLSNVHFPGWIDRPQIEALAERCIAALAPYLNIENFTKNLPNKIIDALSLGLPILSPLQGEVARMIEEHNVGLRYGMGTGKTLYDCIQILLNDQSMQEKISLNAKRLYERQFSYEKVYEDLVNHLEMMAPASNYVKKQIYEYYKYPSSGSCMPKLDIGLPFGYSLIVWRPTITSIAPANLMSFRLFAWWLFHWIKIFNNSKYKIILIFSKNGELAHYSVVLPSHFRFPFMSRDDIQIGPIGTFGCHRNKGLASYAIHRIVNDHLNDNISIWYVVRRENLQSVKLISKMNFLKKGDGVKVHGRCIGRIFSKFYFTRLEI